MAENAIQTPSITTTEHEVELLVSVLPARLREALKAWVPTVELVEIVLDLGRNPEARTLGGSRMFEGLEVTQDDLDAVIAQIGDFGEDNRAGIPRTLHRISAIRNRKGRIIGLTLRVGRAVFGTADLVRDLIVSGQSILLLGRPGVGKTTLLRETARILAESKRVVIVDTSNEIAGDGDIPHPAIGRARRMQVATPQLQHEVMIEAVENHNPEVIVIDEIGRELETQAARTIAERGVQLIGTAHGNTLDNLLMNPTLSDLIGGIESVTLSDEEARRRGTQKSVLERRAPPTFDVLVELQGWQRMAIHADVAMAVDAMLRGRAPTPELRFINSSGETVVEAAEPAAAGVGGQSLGPGPAMGGPRNGSARNGLDPGRRPTSSVPLGPPLFRPADAMSDDADLRIGDAPARKGPIKVYAYGVSQGRLRQTAKSLGVPLILVDDLTEAETMITLKSYYRKRPVVIHDAEARGVPIYVLRSNTFTQIESALADMFGLAARPEESEAAKREVTDAIRSILHGARPMVELAPQPALVRRWQHELVREANLMSISRGQEPNRRVRVFKGGWDDR